MTVRFRTPLDCVHCVIDHLESVRDCPTSGWLDRLKENHEEDTGNEIVGLFRLDCPTSVIDHLESVRDCPTSGWLDRLKENQEEDTGYLEVLNDLMDKSEGRRRMCVTWNIDSWVVRVMFVVSLSSSFGLRIVVSGLAVFSLLIV
ncbi:hypothetical protein Tco_0052570, partial [Tanacetum coccineum]